MNVYELMKGRKIKVMTDMKIEVELEIKEVKPHSHSTPLEAATPQNDWWPASHDWTTYDVYFTNGAVKTYDSLESIKLL